MRDMTGTLPLFDEVADPGDAAALPAQSAHRATEHGATEDRHLRAAWRLSRSMWRFPEGSPQQTRAGLAICHHLQALLQQADGVSE